MLSSAAALHGEEQARLKTIFRLIYTTPNRRRLEPIQNRDFLWTCQFEISTQRPTFFLLRTFQYRNNILKSLIEGDGKHTFRGDGKSIDKLHKLSVGVKTVKCYFVQLLEREDVVFQLRKKEDKQFHANHEEYWITGLTNTRAKMFHISWWYKPYRGLSLPRTRKDKRRFVEDSTELWRKIRECKMTSRKKFLLHAITCPAMNRFPFTFFRIFLVEPILLFLFSSSFSSSAKQAFNV